MKKLKLFTAASGLLVASSVLGEFKMSSIGLDAKIGFDTADVSAGRRSGDKTFTPNAILNVNVSDSFKVYAGFKAILAANGTKVANGGNETDLNVGVKCELNDIFAFDVGYTCEINDSKRTLRDMHGAPLVRLPWKVGADGRAFLIDRGDAARADANAKNDANRNLRGIIDDTLDHLSAKSKKCNHVLHIGVLADYVVHLEAYAKFDVTQKKSSIEGKAGYTFDLASVGMSGLAIDLGLNMGYVHTKKPYGVKNYGELKSLLCDDPKDWMIPAWFDGKDEETFLVGDKRKFKKGYFFVGLNADLVYSINENAKVRAGVGFAHNTADKKSWVNSHNRKKHNVWFSTSAEFSF